MEYSVATGTILTIILLGVAVGLVMRCSHPQTRARTRHLPLGRGSDTGFDSLQRKAGGAGMQYQTSVFQDRPVSPDLIPDSFSSLGKCGPGMVYTGPGHPPDSDSSGFSERPATGSEISYAEFGRGGREGSRPPPYTRGEPSTVEPCWQV